LVVPVGSCEQHGPHLPLDTDTRIAVALAERLCTSLGSRRPETNAGRTDAGADAVVAPAVTVTASGEHHGFPGTLSIGTDTTVDVLVELIRSADWTDGVVLVNGHGGNLDAVRRAVDRTTADGRRVLSWWPRAAGGDAHAGFTETSLLLAIAPHLVRVDRVEAGRLEPVHELMDELRRGGVRAVSTNGVLGDATGATAEHGRRLLDDLTVDLVATVTRAVDGWRGEGST
jgi:creatinine amidohydrolase